MDRHTGIILTTISVLLCACPGTIFCMSGAAMVMAETGNSTLGEPLLGLFGGLFLLLGFALVLVPVIVGSLAFLKFKPKEPVNPADLEEDLPPAI